MQAIGHMEPHRQAALYDGFKQRHDVRIRMYEQGIIIKGKIGCAIPHMPVFDFIGHAYRLRAGGNQGIKAVRRSTGSEAGIRVMSEGG